jgi:2,4-dienoyl-CoA reductase-like NADH-dependent reductase (Old Yellow Enzyme family)
MTSSLSQPLTLPGGTVLSNRIVKAAMSEGLADADNQSTPRLETLYRRWATSGAGLLLSGNLQVDAAHLERAANVVLDDECDISALRRLAAAGKSGGAQFWAQLSHTGRQVVAAINPEPLAPSTVEIDVVRGAGYSFAPPRQMTVREIEHAIRQFACSAAKAKEAGFDGVEIHGAHGYLISQFLSPLTNLRGDRWGGHLRNRARFLLSVIRSVRDAVGPQYPIGLKLNSSDFQRGAFTHADCLEVVRMLNDTSLDLLELSGGSLEQPKVVGVALKDQGIDGPRATTSKREAYFIEFAREVRLAAKMPLMVTGGFRTRAGMEDALNTGELDLIGLGRPFIADPACACGLLTGETQMIPSPEADLHLFHLLGWFNMQLIRLGDGLDPDLSIDGPTAAARFAKLELGMMNALLARRTATGADS